MGDIVTLAYDNYSSKDIPVDPKISRIRPDLDWDDVLFDYAQEKPPRIEGTLAVIYSLLIIF